MEVRLTPWIVIRPVTGWELKAVSSLKRAGFNAYVPVKTVWSRLVREGDARRDRPLFPGYVFVEQPGDMTQLVEMVDNRQLYGVSGFHWTHRDGVRAYMGVDVRGLHLWAACQWLGLFDTTYKPPVDPLKKGDRVRVKSGIAEGKTGEIVKAKGERRVKVFLEEWGRAVNLSAEDVALCEAA